VTSRCACIILEFGILHAPVFERRPACVTKVDCRFDLLHLGNADGVPALVDIDALRAGRHVLFRALQHIRAGDGLVLEFVDEGDRGGIALAFAENFLDLDHRILVGTHGLGIAVLCQVLFEKRIFPPLDS
jgi:hypothetical protein